MDRVSEWFDKNWFFPLGDLLL